MARYSRERRRRAVALCERYEHHGPQARARPRGIIKEQGQTKSNKTSPPPPAHKPLNKYNATRAPVRDQHVRARDPAEQPTVRGRVLPVAPLPGQGPAVLARGDRQAPAVRHVRAVRLDVMVHDPVRRDRGPDVPAPRHARCERLPGNPDRRRRLAHRPRAGDPVQERAELRHPTPRPRSRTPLNRQSGHSHRCLPALVKPFLRMRSPHNGQRIALDDLLLLMEQANQRCQAPPENDRHDEQHPTTHKTPAGLTRNLKPTFLYLTLKGGYD